MSTAVPLKKTSGEGALESGSIWRAALVLVAAGTLFTIVAALMFVIQLCSMFRSRRFCSEVLARWMGNAMLKVSGVRMEVHDAQNRRSLGENTQVVFVTNHTSTVDVFVLLALGLPRTRFFLWGGLRTLFPVAVIGYLTGVFFTPTQSRRDKRVRCFQNAEAAIRRTGESVLLSPEGRCVTVGGISRFNLGAFHLATNLKAPIVPVFIAIPRHMNPGRGYGVLPGVVHVHFSSPIPTAEWRLEDLEKNKEIVRDLYVDWNERLRQP